ncbi:LysR family transcriptional regulator [uncultured Zhongshania sp.]|uniref:LysR family transcriptional regulator n=1 Tax=uncultured Zhongshania sp. TaxID=1642288 RepID=UPI0030DDBC07|tara:strand:+ start:1795 stop:2703 length:909 start_codon:yes stop_codon:yes gene_type:complete
MSNQHLPSLNLIRVFEVAARRMSFKDAADELFVSPPAVSHQIRALEENLGVTLFKRANRKITLTPEGKRYYLHIKRGLDLIHTATLAVRKEKKQRRFVINTLPNIASLLLFPNIHEFQAQHPELNIQIDSDVSRIDLENSETNVAIRHECGNEPELTYHPLVQIALTPICSRSYLEQHPKLRNGDFRNCRLIKISGDTYQWPRWQTQWNLLPDTSNELVVSTVQASIEAVKNNIGVAMGYLPTAHQFMNKDDDLVLPMPDKVTPHGECFLTYCNSNADDEIIKAFYDWMVRIIAEEWKDKKN